MKPATPSIRHDHLDATRAFALVLGIVFHASLSFMPVFIGWAVQDISTGPFVAVFVMVSHAFRMELFFLLAGFFGYAMLRRRGVGAFVRSRLLRLGVPFLLGWFILRPLLVSGWIMGAASLRGDYEFWIGVRSGFATLQGLPSGLLTGTHLWFLYYLVMVTGLVLVGRALLVAGGPHGTALMRKADAALAWLAGSRWRLPLLVAPTATVLWFMRNWGMDTPDQSLAPDPRVTVVYGGFFVLGWLLGRQPDLLDDFTRVSRARWAAALVGVGGTIVLSAFQADPGHRFHMVARGGFVVGYALMMWSLVFLTIGLFRKWCNRPRPVVRYLADAAYWLYLAHLPVVVWLQVACAEWPLHWSIKLGLISAATLAGLLVVYDVLVRPTIIGQILNGRRMSSVLFAPWVRREVAAA